MSSIGFWAINLIALAIWAPSAYIFFKSWYKSPERLAESLKETQGDETRTLFKKGVKDAVGNELFEIGLAAFVIYQIIMLVVCRSLALLVAGWFGYQDS